MAQPKITKDQIDTGVGADYMPIGTLSKDDIDTE